jgi:hypothetical protein
MKGYVARKRLNWRKIKQRLRQILIYDADIRWKPGLRKEVEQPHRLNKKTAFGCNKSHCKICRKKRNEMEKE